MISTLYGIADLGRSRSAGASVDRMGKDLSGVPGSYTSGWTQSGSGVAVGAQHTGSPDAEPAWALDERKNILCVLEGLASSRAHVSGRYEGKPVRASEMLRAYNQQGADCLLGFEGSFNVLWWHRGEERLVVANDRVGYRNLYVNVDDRSLTFGSRIGAVVAGMPTEPRIDPAMFATWLRFKYPPGCRTLFRDVEILSPGSVLTWNRGRVTIDRYWRIDQVEVNGGYGRARRRRLEESLRASARAAFPVETNRVLGLTGGLDSRCLLAAGLAEDRSPRTMTDGLPGSTDLELARKVARRAGVIHSFHPTNPERLGHWLPTMVRLQGGTVPTLEAHPCAYVFDPLEHDGLVLGMVGEPARGGLAHAPELGLRTRAEVTDAVESRIMSDVAGIDEYETLWNAEHVDVARSAPRAELEGVLRGYEYSDHIAEIMEHFYVESRGRRFLAKATLIAGAAGPVVLPYLDSRWLSEVFSLPLSVRASGRVQLDLIERLRPDLLEIPFDRPKPTTLMAGFAPRIRGQLGRLYRRVRRRISGTDSSPSGRPAFPYDRWIREEMGDVVRDLLYNPNAAYNQFLRRRELRVRLDRHFEGREESTHLISGLAVFELVHGLWIEPERLPARVQDLPGIVGRAA